MGDTLRRIGILGDVHTEYGRLALALDHLGTQNVDALVCTGDVADGPEGADGVERCCKLLQDARVLTIAGNHDRWLQDSVMRTLDDAVFEYELDRDTLSYLASLPPTVEIATLAGPLLLCHGLGEDDLAQVMPHDHGHALRLNDVLQTFLREASQRLVVNGHSHKAMVRTIDGLTIINAGTLLRDHRPCCAVADFERREVQFWDLVEESGVRPGARLSLP